MKAAKAVRLVNELRKHSRRSLAELAEVTDTPLSTVYKQVGRLFRDKVITRNISLLDFAGLGFPYKAGVFLSTDKKEDLKQFLLDHPSLNTLIRLSGDYDYYAELVFRDMAECQDFMDELKSLIVKKTSLHFMTDLRREQFRLKESLK